MKFPHVNIPHEPALYLMPRIPLINYSAHFTSGCPRIFIALCHTPGVDIFSIVLFS